MEKEDSQNKKEFLSELASRRARDEHGHFAPNPQPQSSPSNNSGILTDLLHDSAAISKTTDDDTLLNVHIGNPLRRITLLLEEIKKQKAFSFSIKGSLGLAGIILVLSTFGIFGGTKALCAKGVQSHIGFIRVLDLPEDSSDPSFIDRALAIWNTLIGKSNNSSSKSRLVLVKQNQDTLRVTGALPDDLSILKINQVIATGDMDSCSQTLTLKSPKSMQIY